MNRAGATAPLLWGGKRGGNSIEGSRAPRRTEGMRSHQGSKAFLLPTPACTPPLPSLSCLLSSFPLLLLPSCIHSFTHSLSRHRFNRYHLSDPVLQADSTETKSRLEALFFFYFIFVNVYLFLRERERQSMSGRAQRERETQNPKQAPGSELSAQSPMWASSL